MTGDPLNNPHTGGLIKLLFTDAADEDYLVARVSFRLGMANQFSWSAQQSLEKYLKGALLFNNIGVKSFKHELDKLLVEVRKIAGDLLPDCLCPPNGFPTSTAGHWGAFEPLDSVVKRFLKNGSTHQRYRLHGHMVTPNDLHYFDELCFLLRRLNVTLSAPFLKGAGSFRDWLSVDKNAQPRGDLRLPSRSPESASDETLEFARWRNFSYFPESAIEGGLLANFMYAENSPTSTYLGFGPESLESVRWIKDNVQLKKSDCLELTAAIKRWPNV